MSETDSKVTTGRSRGRVFALGLFVMVFLCCLYSCSLVSPEARKRQTSRLYDKAISNTYDLTRIRKSLTLDVLPRISKAKDELLSQSDNVVASVGSGKGGYKAWFTMVRFHEFDFSVIRKYFFVVDEKVAILNSRGLRFDCEMLLSKEEIAKIIAARGLKQIAILNGIVANLDKDVAELGTTLDGPGQTNRTLDVSVMLIKQVFEAIFRELDKFPVLVTKLSDPEGVNFEHLTLGKGKIRVAAEGDVIKVKIRLGALLRTFKDLEEVTRVAPAAPIQPAPPAPVEPAPIQPEPIEPEPIVPEPIESEPVELDPMELMPVETDVDVLIPIFPDDANLVPILIEPNEPPA